MSDEKQRVAPRCSPGSPSRRISDPGISTAAEGRRSLPGRLRVTDCAVIDFSGEASSGLGFHGRPWFQICLFELGLLSYYDIGYFLVAANISDVAAMGADLIGVLTVVRYPKGVAGL